MNRFFILLEFKILIAIYPLFSFVICNDLFNRLCTPSFIQIDELINRAFYFQTASQNFSIIRRWTYKEYLRDFCAQVGVEDENLPELLKISTVKLKSDSNKEFNNVDILITIKVPINRFFVDTNKETSHNYWLLYRWPFEPFYCSSCRSFLTYSTEHIINQESKILFIYGIMQNKFPSIVDPERFESIKREVKKNFLKQTFEFSNSIQKTDTGTVNINKVNKFTITLMNDSLFMTNDSSILSNELNDINMLTFNSTVRKMFSNEKYTDIEKNKRSIYVNISSFAHMNKYFLVGMNMNNSDNIINIQNIFSNGNSTSNRSKKSLNKIFHVDKDAFYLEYSLCFNLMKNRYVPSSNCFPLFVEDQLKSINGKKMSIADCICWNFHAYKNFIFYQILLLFIFSCFFIIFWTKFNHTKTLNENLKKFKYYYTNTPAQNINLNSRIVIYQIVLQIHNPIDDKCRLPGNLHVKLFTNLNQPFFEFDFTSSNKFSRPFLFFDDIIQTSSFIYSDIVIDNIKKIVVELEISENRFQLIYLYGIIITNGYNSMFVFPYSNYIAHQTEVHLCERNVWLNYISRHDNVINMRHILPITIPINIRMSKIEKILFYMIIVCRYAFQPLYYREYEDVHYLLLFLFDIIISIFFYIFVVVFLVVSIKKITIQDYYFIRLNYDIYEGKFFYFIFFMFLFHNVVQSISEITTIYWKDDITITNILFYEDILLNNDLSWLLMFFSLLIVFFITSNLFDIYFYNSRKRQGITPGPSNSIADRTFTNN